MDALPAGLAAARGRRGRRGRRAGSAAGRRGGGRARRGRAAGLQRRARPGRAAEGAAGGGGAAGLRARRGGEARPRAAPRAPQRVEGGPRGDPRGQRLLVEPVHAPVLPAALDAPVDGGPGGVRRGAVPRDAPLDVAVGLAQLVDRLQLHGAAVRHDAAVRSFGSDCEPPSSDPVRRRPPKHPPVLQVGAFLFIVGSITSLFQAIEDSTPLYSGLTLTPYLVGGVFFFIGTSCMLIVSAQVRRAPGPGPASRAPRDATATLTGRPARPPAARNCTRRTRCARRLSRSSRRT